MDDVFRSLQKEGKNCAENLMKWMENSGLIENTEECQRNVRVLFENASEQSKVDLEKFKEIVQKVAKESNKTFEEVAGKLAAEGPKLKAEFDEKIKPKLIEATKDGEEKARSFFSGVNPKNIELPKFKEVVERLAAEQNKTFDEIAKQLTAEGPKLLQTAMAGVAALKDKLSMK